MGRRTLAETMVMLMITTVSCRAKCSSTPHLNRAVGTDQSLGTVECKVGYSSISLIHAFLKNINQYTEECNRSGK